MTGFIEWLEGISKKDTKVRAVLRRSLAFDSGTHVPAFPYVEPFLKEENNSWRREMLYLVAGVWAAHWREGRAGTPESIGKACAIFDSEKRKTMSPDERQKLTSTESRFIALLDADRDQLPHRLRQMITLLKEQPIDFESLLTGLLYWSDEQKRTQNAWARDYYRNLSQETAIEYRTEKETAE